MKRASSSGERSNRRRAEIVRSASAAFARRGYHGASVAEIARAIGMTKGNLYYYFRNKEEILFFCHDYSLDILLRLLEHAQADPRPPDLKLRGLLVGFIHVILDELHGTSLTQEIQALSPPLLRRVVAKRDRFEDGLRGLVQQGMDAGVFAKGDAKLFTFAILGAVNWITRWYSPAGPLRSDRIAETFADFLMAGLAGRGAADARELPVASAARRAPRRS